MTDVRDGRGAVVSFTAMEDGTDEDYRLLDRFEREHAAGLADRLLATLGRLSDSLGGYQVTRLEHSLQAATRARLDGADVDWVVAALLHDIGDELAPHNHAEVAAADPRAVRARGGHLGDRATRPVPDVVLRPPPRRRPPRAAAFADHPWYGLCEQFCARWDQSSFDPDFPSHDLDSFADDVRTVFSRPAWDPPVIAHGPAVLVP